MEHFINVLQPDGSIQQLEDNQFIDLGEGVNYNPRLFALSSGGSGDDYYCMYLVEFNPESMIPCTNNPDLIFRNNHPVLVFPKGGNKVAYFECVMPSRGTLGFPSDVLGQWQGFYYVHLHWTAEAATVTWEVSFENISKSGFDIDEDNFNGDITGSGTSNGEAIITTIEISGAQIPGTDVDAKDMFRLRIKRQDSGTTVDAHLLAVDIQWHYIEPIV